MNFLWQVMYTRTFYYFIIINIHISAIIRICRPEGREQEEPYGCMYTKLWSLGCSSLYLHRSSLTSQHGSKIRLIRSLILCCVIRSSSWIYQRALRTECFTNHHRLKWSPFEKIDKTAFQLRVKCLCEDTHFRLHLSSTFFKQTVDWREAYM